MTCTIFDKLYFEGMSQPIIGTFTMKLGDILTSTREHDNEKVKELHSIAQQMMEVLDKKKKETENDKKNIGQYL